MKYLLALLASAAANTNIENKSGFNIYVRYDKYDSYLTSVSKEGNLDISATGIKIGGKSSKTYELKHRPSGFNLIKAGEKALHHSKKNDKVQLSVIVIEKTGNIGAMVISNYDIPADRDYLFTKDSLIMKAKGNSWKTPLIEGLSGKNLKESKLTNWEFGDFEVYDWRKQPSISKSMLMEAVSEIYAETPIADQSWIEEAVAMTMTELDKDDYYTLELSEQFIL